MSPKKAYIQLLKNKSHETWTDWVTHHNIAHAQIRHIEKNFEPTECVGSAKVKLNGNKKICLN